MGGKGKDKNGKGAGVRESGDRPPRANGKDSGKGKGYKGGGKASKPVVEEKPEKPVDPTPAEKRIFFDATQTKTVPTGMTWASALRNKKEQPKPEEVVAAVEAEPEKVEQTIPEPETAENEPWPEREPEPEAVEPEAAREFSDPQPLPKAVMQQVHQPAATEAVKPPPASLPLASAIEPPAPASASLPAPTPVVISQPLVTSPASLPPSSVPAPADKKPEEPKPKKTASRRFHDQTESVVLPCGFNAPASKAKFSFCAADATGPAIEKAKLPNESEWAHETEDPQSHVLNSAPIQQSSAHQQHQPPSQPPSHQQPSPSQQLSQLQQSQSQYQQQQQQQQQQQDYRYQESRQLQQLQQQQQQQQQLKHQDQHRQQQWKQTMGLSQHGAAPHSQHAAQMPKASASQSVQYARSLYEQQRGGAIGPSRSQQSPSNMTSMGSIQSAMAMNAMGGMQNMNAMRGNSSGGRSNYYQNQGGNFDSFSQYSQYSQAYPGTSYSAYQSDYGPVGNYSYGRDMEAPQTKPSYGLHSQGQQHLGHSIPHQQQHLWRQHQQQQRAGAGGFGGSLGSSYTGSRNAFSWQQ